MKYFQENHDDDELQCELPNDHEVQADTMHMEQKEECTESYFTCTELFKITLLVQLVHKSPASKMQEPYSNHFLFIHFFVKR